MLLRFAAGLHYSSLPPQVPAIRFSAEFQLGCRQPLSRELGRGEVVPSRPAEVVRQTVNLRVRAPRKLFKRHAACKMQRNPGSCGVPHEKVSVSNIEPRLEHTHNKADLPSARSISASSENQGASRHQSIVSMQTAWQTLPRDYFPLARQPPMVPFNRNLIGGLPTN